MPRTQIQDLPQNAKISAKEMEQVLGGSDPAEPDPFPWLGLHIAPQRGELATRGGDLSGPISSVDPYPDPPF